jgi:hypothetical protein
MIEPILGRAAGIAAIVACNGGTPETNCKTTTKSICPFLIILAGVYIEAVYLHFGFFGQSPLIAFHAS